MMSFFSFAALATLAVATNSSAPVNGTTNGTASYSTEVVTAYTTYCPYPTTFAEGSSTYTVTAPTTLTITDCPCTRTHTYQTTTVTSSCSSSSSAAPAVAATNATTGPVFANGVAKNSVPLAALGGAAAVAMAFI